MEEILLIISLSLNLLMLCVILKIKKRLNIYYESLSELGRRNLDKSEDIKFKLNGFSDNNDKHFSSFVHKVENLNKEVAGLKNLANNIINSNKKGKR